MAEKQIGVIFDALNQGPQMRRNISEAKRVLRAYAKKSGLRLKSAPLPADAIVYPVARVEGPYRVIVQWDAFPHYGPPRYMGRVDALAVRV